MSMWDDDEYTEASESTDKRSASFKELTLNAKGVHKAYCVHCNMISKDVWTEFFTLCSLTEIFVHFL